MPAVPEVPITITGMTRCWLTDPNLAQLIGLLDELGIHQAADRQAEIDLADIEQHQRQQEVRHRRGRRSR